MGITNRNIAVAIVLSLVTCGIYGIYWFVVLVNDVKTVSKDESLPTGGVAFLLTLVTCGIYGYYLFYKLGKALFNSKIVSSDSSILYLVLQLFGLGIVNYALIQNELNNKATN